MMPTFEALGDKGHLVTLVTPTSFSANNDLQQIIQTKYVDFILFGSILNDFALPIIDHLGVSSQSWIGSLDFGCIDYEC